MAGTIGAEFCQTSWAAGEWAELGRWTGLGRWGADWAELGRIGPLLHWADGDGLGRTKAWAVGLVGLLAAGRIAGPTRAGLLGARTVLLSARTILAVHERRPCNREARQIRFKKMKIGRRRVVVLAEGSRDKESKRSSPVELYPEFEQEEAEDFDV
ncbi:hypothetical protein CRG98_043966 [Punica granatum]|uniref:Uncharacterized protein n=1 Tax=Punica granatum TaxID=22663 RepID=A0A2I0HVB0_PUNGR|nr:hypothetical protein CRG98_043966 [Punica granatum]